MATAEKLFQSIMCGTQDKNIKFRDLQKLLKNIQPDKKDRSKAKSYQVRQIRNFINLYGIKGDYNV
ncbi:MAG: type II toxin-antitoxin system HicA family toxin [Lachnospiraceae bacterium]|nr:type II toxin-antitoxin system HicA family toxin [Lachnospiraceae bacterium]